MDIAPTCPDCGLTDLEYQARAVRPCGATWHQDAYLRHKGGGHIEIDKGGISRRERQAVDAALRQAEEAKTSIQMRAEVSRRHFEAALERFVDDYAPPYSTNARKRDAFQRDLMMLMRDAIEHKSMVFGLHIDRTESTLHALSMHATGPLQHIFETEAQRQTREVKRRQFENVMHGIFAGHVDDITNQYNKPKED